MPLDEKNLIWMDLEMTGLDPFKDRILELATIVTDTELNILAEAPVIVVKTWVFSVGIWTMFVPRNISGTSIPSGKTSLRTSISPFGA